jgi:hypothetical protein
MRYRRWPPMGSIQVGTDVNLETSAYLSGLPAPANCTAIAMKPASEHDVEHAIDRRAEGTQGEFC